MENKEFKEIIIQDVKSLLEECYIHWDGTCDFKKDGFSSHSGISGIADKSIKVYGDLTTFEMTVNSIDFVLVNLDTGRTIDLSDDWRGRLAGKYGQEYADYCANRLRNEKANEERE